MNINDFLIPIFVIIIIIAIFIFLTKNKTKINTNSIETFQTSTKFENHDLSKYQVNIGDNLFVGFGSKVDAINNRYLLQDAKMRFPDKMKNIFPDKNSIFINKRPSNTVGNICLGSPKYTGEKMIEKLEEHKKNCNDDGENCDYYTPEFLKDNYDKCLNTDTLQSFDLKTNSIPYFKDWRGKQVYYNQDQQTVKHDKLCFSDVKNKNSEVCLTQQDIDMINGKYAVRLKMKDDRGEYKKLRPYNLHYGYHRGFGGAVSTPHYMLENEFSNVNSKLIRVPNCFTTGTHYGSDSGYFSDNYYLSPDPRPLNYYTHIHQHEDA
jgi:hypothetical protein